MRDRHLRYYCSCGRLKDRRSKQCRRCYDQAPVDGRVCTVCKIAKPISDFRIRTRIHPRPRSVCRACETQRQLQRYHAKPLNERKLATRAWEKRNPEKVARHSLSCRIKRLGLEAERDVILVEFFKRQGCSICSKSPAPGSRYRRLHIDHDETTGRFRGLLCSECNLGLGKFDHDPELLGKAIEYLMSQRNRAHA